MRLGRRHVLGLGLAAMARLAAPRPGFADVPGGRGDAARFLREFILQRAAPSTDPWIEMHVVLALGAGFERDGKNLLDELVARTLVMESVGVRRYPHFPLDIERHPFHMLQIMQSTEVPGDRVFETPHGKFSRRDLVDGGTALLVPSEIDDELSWVVAVLCNEFPPQRDRFETARGLEIVVGELVRRHLSEAEEAYADVLAVMRGERLYGKGPLHRTACNGMHLLFGLLEAMRYGYRQGDIVPRVERLVEATLFRARLEPVLIDRAMPGDDPRIALNRDAAKFTFLGHAVEFFGYARRHGTLDLTPDAWRAAEAVRGQLVSLSERITTDYDLEALAGQVPRAYKLILGDACHAYRGLRLWG